MLENATAIFQKMNEWFALSKPFFFLLDYKAEKGDFCDLESLEKNQIRMASPLFSTPKRVGYSFPKLHFSKLPESFDSYKGKFDQVMAEIQRGNSYLTNLTCCTSVSCNYSLDQLFTSGTAKYKLLYKDQFVHFSPETFVRIHNNKIETFPMKGTIDATIENAEQKILENFKEKTEQYIITDLMRNDLAKVADDVIVERFRYVEPVITHEKKLLQVSSHISGTIKKSYRQEIGNLFSQLLPAGSICGAPKQKTTDIIEKVEQYPRGFYTGVWGIFDGETLDSNVMIRMLEKTPNGFVFKSGGGITAASNVVSEYQEMIDKIYVPIY